MKYVMFLYTESDKIKARKLRDYLQGRLRNITDLRSIGEISAEKRDFRNELRCNGDCVVLVGSRHAFSLIKGKQQEADDDFLTFDGKVIHEEFSGNREFIDKLIIVYLATERANDDWIPDGLDEKRIFNLQGEKNCGKSFAVSARVFHKENIAWRFLYDVENTTFHKLRETEAERHLVRTSI